MMSAYALDVIRRAARWFEADQNGFGLLRDCIGDASLVLIGEASHGTSWLYDEADLPETSRRLFWKFSRR
jgi:erythromycin esterase-like protein